VAHEHSSWEVCTSYMPRLMSHDVGYAHHMYKYTGDESYVHDLHCVCKNLALADPAPTTALFVVSTSLS